jgi:hypothetical protein
LTIHDSSTYSLPDEFGSNVMPNTLTTFAMHEVNITREPSPYTSNCTYDWSMTNYSSFLPASDYTYTLAVSKI